MRNKQILLSGRAVVTNAANVPADRYTFLHLSDAEPNLGTANANGWVLVYDTETSGNRRWSEKLITGYNHANAAYQSQNVTGTYANNAYAHANAAYESQNVTGTYANNAYLHANSAYQSQNITGTYANNAYLHANSAYQSQNITGTYANNAYAHANGSYLHANAAYQSQNITGTYANNAYAHANSSYLHANAAYQSQNITGTYANNAYAHANSGYIHANSAYQSQNITGTYANNAYLHANSGYIHANSAYQSQNVTGTYANNAYLHANSGYIHANLSYDHANAAYQSQNVTGTYANNAYLHANSGYIHANSGYIHANSAYDHANAAYQSQNVTGTYANNAYAHANAAYQSQNVTGTYANNAYLHANSAYESQNVTGTYANNAYLHSNSAYNQANVGTTLAQNAYDNSNTKFNIAGGTIAGNVTVANNLTVLGNVTFIGNVTSLQVTGNSGQFFGYSSNGFTALYAGIPVGYDFQPQTVFQVSANDDGYAQINIQNINPGGNASGDYVATADNGTEDDTYVDLGIASSTHNDPEFTLVGPNDAYLYSHGNTSTSGGDLVIGTFLPQNDVIISVGGMNIENEQMRIIGSSNTINVRANLDTSLSKSVLLGPVANIHVTGGLNDDFIRTDGLGNLTFTSLTSANVIKVLYTTTNSAFVQANAAYESQNVTGTYANNAYLHANASFIHANSGYVHANSSFAAQNITGTYANSAYIHANLSYAHANAAYQSQNVTGTYANNAYAHANAAYQSQNVTGTYANNAYDQANSASLYANAAFIRANNSLDANNGGSVTGTVSVTGNLIANYIIANSGFASTAGGSKLQLSDIGLVVIDVAGQQFKFGGGGIESSPGIYGGSFGGNKLSLSNETNLISNRYDVVKIQTGTDGTVANEWIFANTSLTAPGNITATGFIAGGINIAPYAIVSFVHANSAYDSQNVTGTYANNAYLHANAAYQSQNVTGTYANNAYVHANSAYESQNVTGIVANAAFLKTNSAYQHANSAYDSQNVTLTYANSAYAHANSGYLAQNVTGIYANAAFIKANAAMFSITPNTNEIWVNTSTGNVQIGLANVTTTIGTFGGATAIPVINVDGHGRVLSVSNTTISVPPGTYIFPNTNQLTSNANFGNVQIGLANVNLNIGTYGSEFAVPTITTDGYGRVVGISNTTISIPQGTYIVNSNLITSNSSTGNVVLGLAESGVAAGIYGGAGKTPVLTVDVYGRILTASNVDSSVNTLSTMIRNSYTATAAQTIFQTSTSFEQNYADVYVNGIKLSPADYTSNGVLGQIVINAPTLLDNDVVDIQTATTYIVNSNTNYQKADFVATAGQTTVTVDYVPGQVNVYLNGLRLQNGTDYTAVTGTSIVFPVALELNDIIEVEKIGSAYIQIANSYFMTRNTITVTANGDSTFIIGGGYRVGYTDIFYNGIKLNVPDDVTAVDGTTITLVTTSSEIGDFIEIVGLGPQYSIANALPVTGGTIYGSLNVSQNVSANHANIGTLHFSDGTTMVTAASGSGGSGITWKIVSANTTANTTEGFLVDTSSANVYITLNASPYLGNTTRIVDMTGNFGINNCIIKGNGKKIMGSTDDLIISSNNAGIGLVFSNITHGWRIIENP